MRFATLSSEVRMIRMRREAAKVLAAACLPLLGMTAGCDGQPTEPTRQPLALQSLHIGEAERGGQTLENLWLEAGGALLITAYATDPATISDRTHLEFEVTTNAGEREVITVRQGLCGDGKQGSELHICRRFGVTMNNGVDVRTLLPNLRHHSQAVLSRVVAGGQYGTIEVPNGNLAAVMSTVKQWSGVQSVWLDQVAGPDVLGWEPTQHLRGAMPLVYAEPTANDGTVQVRPGDVLIVNYVQPDGTILSTSIDIPEPVN